MSLLALPTDQRSNADMKEMCNIKENLLKKFQLSFIYIEARVQTFQKNIHTNGRFKYSRVLLPLKYIRNLSKFSLYL